MTSPERITHEPGEEDAWVCLCGNLPCDDGFYTCDVAGNEVEPTEAAWTSGLYVCAACGRVIEPHSLWVVGRNPSPVLLA